MGTITFIDEPPTPKQPKRPVPNDYEMLANKHGDIIEITDQMMADNGLKIRDFAYYSSYDHTDRKLIQVFTCRSGKQYCLKEEVEQITKS